MMSDCPGEWLSENASVAAERPALVTKTGSVSFAMLDKAVATAASGLIAAGVDPGQPLGLVVASAQRLLILVLACFRAGIPCFPLNPRLPVESIQTRLGAAGVTAAVSGTALPLPLRTIDPALPGASPPLPADRPTSADAVHVVIATSGSAGDPKGVMLTGANLAAAVRASRRRMALGPDDAWLGCLPLYAIGGLSVPLRCLEASAVCRLHESFDAHVVGADLESGAVTHVSLVPAMLASLLDLNVRPAKRLRTVLVGGAALSAEVAERAWRAGWPIVPSYGMSEAASQVASFTEAMADWRPGLAGQPLDGVRVEIGQTGRIRVTGPSVMAGYANPGLKKGTGLDKDGWFETSDLGRIDAKGRLEVRGRADDVLVSGGINIHPLEVEHLAGRCPGLRTLAVTGRADSVWGELIVAVIVGDIGPDAFLGWCRDNMPSPLRPRRAIAVDALPELASGKLDRAGLRRLAAG